MAPLRAINGSTAKCNRFSCDEPWQVVLTLVAACFWQETTTKCLWQEASLRYAGHTEQCLIVRIALLTLTTDRHEASRGLSAIAGLLVNCSSPTSIQCRPIIENLLQFKTRPQLSNSVKILRPYWLYSRPTNSFLKQITDKQTTTTS